MAFKYTEHAVAAEQYLKCANDGLPEYFRGWRNLWVDVEASRLVGPFAFFHRDPQTEETGHVERTGGFVDAAQLKPEPLSQKREDEANLPSAPEDNCTPPEDAPRTARKRPAGSATTTTSRKPVATSQKRKREVSDGEGEEVEGEAKQAGRRATARGVKDGPVHTDKKPRVEPNKRKSRAQPQPSEHSSEDNEARENVLRKTTRKSYLIKPEPLMEIPMTARTRRQTLKGEKEADGAATVQRKKRGDPPLSRADPDTGAPQTAGKGRVRRAPQTSSQDEADEPSAPTNDEPAAGKGAAQIRARAVRGRNAGRQAQLMATPDCTGAQADNRRRSTRRTAAKAEAESASQPVEAEQTMVEPAARRRRTVLAKGKPEGDVKVEPEAPVPARAQAGRRRTAVRGTKQPTPKTDDGQEGVAHGVQSQEEPQEPQAQTTDQREGVAQLVAQQVGKGKAAGSAPTITMRRTKRTKAEPKESPQPPSQDTQTSAPLASPQAATEAGQIASQEAPATTPPAHPALSPPLEAKVDTTPARTDVLMATQGASSGSAPPRSIPRQRPTPTPTPTVTPAARDTPLPPAPSPPTDGHPSSTATNETHPTPTAAPSSTTGNASHPSRHSITEQTRLSHGQPSDMLGEGDTHVHAAATQEKGSHRNRKPLKRRTKSIALKGGKRSGGAYGWNGRSPGKNASTGGEQRRSHSTMTGSSNATRLSSTFESNPHTGRSMGGNTEHVVEGVEEEEEEGPPPIQEENEVERDSPVMSAPAPSEPTLAPETDAAADPPNRVSHVLHQPNASPQPTAAEMPGTPPLPDMDKPEPNSGNVVGNAPAAQSPPPPAIATTTENSVHDDVQAAEVPVAASPEEGMDDAPPTTVEAREDGGVPANIQTTSQPQEPIPQPQTTSPPIPHPQDPELLTDDQPAPTPCAPAPHETVPAGEVVGAADLPNMAGVPMDESVILRADPVAAANNSTMPMVPSPTAHRPPPAEECTMVPETPQEKPSPPAADDFAEPNIATDVRFVSTRARWVSSLGDMTPSGPSQALGSTPFVPHVAPSQSHDLQPMAPGMLLIDQSPIAHAPPRAAPLATAQVRPPGSAAKVMKPASPQTVKAPSFGRLQLTKSGTKTAGTPGRPKTARPESGQKVVRNMRDPRSPPPTLKRNHDTIAEEGSEGNTVQETAKRPRTDPMGADQLHGLEPHMSIMPSAPHTLDQAPASVAGRGMTAGPAGFGASTFQTYLDNSTMGRGRTLVGSTIGARGMDPAKRVRTYEERKKIQEENLRRVEEDKRKKLQEKKLKEISDREKQLAELGRQQRLKAEEARRRDLEAAEKRKRLAEEKAREEEAKREAMRQADEALLKRQEELARQEQEKKKREAEKREEDERRKREMLDLEMQLKEEKRQRQKQQEVIEEERRAREKERRALEEERRAREKERRVLEEERVERLRLEKQREAERKKEEEERRKREQEEKERAEKERLEQEKKKQEQAERERQELERTKAQLEQMMKAFEEREREFARIREEREREVEQARLERERAEKEAVEKERLLEEERQARERERVEKERLLQERLAQERERAEKERVMEGERLERERALREKEHALEQERLAREEAEREKERERVRRQQAEEQARAKMEERERLAQLREEKEAAEQRAAEQAKRVAALQEEKERERREKESAQKKLREANERTFARPPATPAMTRVTGAKSGDRAFRSIMNSPYVNSTPRTRSKKPGVPHSHRKTPAEELVELESLEERAHSRPTSTPMAAPLGSRLPSDAFKAPAPIAKAKAEPVAEAAVEDEIAESDVSLQDYGIDDLSSGSDTDYDDDPKKPIPGWANGKRFKEAIYSQDPSTPPFFKAFRNQPVEDMGLEAIFGKKMRPALKRRGSSVGWNNSP